MSNKETKSELQFAADRASADAFFLGHEIRAYQDCFGVTEEQVRKMLGCSAEDLARLCLCRRPDSSAATFVADIQQIADYAKIDALPLVRIIREVEALRAITSAPAPAQHSGMLLAARDRSLTRKRRHRRKKPD